MRFIRLHLSIYVSICIFVLSSCAIGRKVNYSINPSINSSDQITIAIGTFDQREAIVQNKRKQDFVGYCRSGAGIAYPMGTKNDRNLSDIISDAICNSFNTNKCKCEPFYLNYSENKSDIINKMKQSKPDRIILIILNKWHTDSYGVTVLYYDIIAELYDENGDFITARGVTGEEVLGKNVWGSSKKDYSKAAYYLENKLETIFTNPDIQEALRDE